MSEAVLFPGQGAQAVGMGKDWCEAFPTARKVFADASRVLGFSLEDACWARGDDVHRTDIAQPGIFVVGVAVASVLIERGFDARGAALTAGLSLGEYTALWFAGSLAFDDAVRLVRLRGAAMQRASEALPSGMLSLMGASDEQAYALAAVGARVGLCSVANLNAPGQIIVSGENRALYAVEAAAKDHGVRRARRLVVAGGFHSECMRPAALELERALASIEIRPPRIPFVTNVTGEPVSDPQAIRRNLALQVCAPTLWEKSMRWALAQGIREYLEPAPGKVLAGLLSKIEPTAKVRSAATPADIEAAASGA
ncbi:MAG: ACP S-malonyltransferase [Planctomycetes bacterium]|nr:ACP S-malonyltransferase [Planctomycetota bacterium]